MPPNVLSGNPPLRDLPVPFPLRPYQYDGIRFLVQSTAALIADEMGLGKTIQAIMALRVVLQSADYDRSLIIVPSSLVFNWEQELQCWAPNLVVRRIRGSMADRIATYKLPCQLLIASYDQVRADLKQLSGISFGVVVLDEAQRIKNTDTSTFHACRVIPRKRSWALTGTPVETSAEDLVSIYQFLLPGLLHGGLSLTELHRRIRPYFLRRIKRTVYPELPPIITQDLSLELEGDQLSAYNDAWRNRRASVCRDGLPASNARLFATITKLKQLCNYDPRTNRSVKMDVLRLILDKMSEPHDKILVFSQYVRTLRWISNQLPSFPHAIFSGDVSDHQRHAILQEFSQRAGPRALLVSLRAGGVGLNLQAATTVLLFDRWWNPATEEQAIHRAHRFGRKLPLQVVRFLVRNSIEERIARILKEKKALFTLYVDQAQSVLMPTLSRDALRAMLGVTSEAIGNGHVEASSTKEGK